MDGAGELGSDTPSYRSEGITCCAPTVSRSFYAFVDLDGDEAWDDDEPWGENPNNPVELSADGYASVVVIDRFGEP